MPTAKPFVPSAYQQKLFQWVSTGRGSAVVIAVAGSGKTTSIVRCLPLIPEHQHVQVLAFNSPVAKDMKTAIERIGAEAGRPFRNVRASTFHSLGVNAVARKLGKRVMELNTDSKKLGKLCQAWLGEHELEMYSGFICKLVSYAKGEGIGAIVPDTEDRWYSLIQHHDLMLDAEQADEAHAVGLARQLLARSNEVATKAAFIDFDDQLYLPLLWKLRLWQNDWVIIDEAQDTNPVRRALAKAALKPGGRLMAVGDPRQAIYGFTGASHDAIDIIKREFSAIELQLTVSYRCPQAVAELAREIVPYFEAAEGAIEGQVSNLDINEAIKLLGPHDAVLCRQTAPLMSLAFQLIARKVGCVMLGRDIGSGLVSLVKQMKAKNIEGLDAKLTAFLEREVAAYMAKGEEQKAEMVTDRVACVRTVIEHLPENSRSIPKLIAQIEGMFSDENGVLTLCSQHKSKGREWDNVAILAPELNPSRWARQEWQHVQEQNLMYVAWTRAMKHLMFLSGKLK
jgi:DNA helicase-2/ATP-dependent DNA helicase PcrA